MADESLRFKKGLHANIPDQKEAGSILFETDTGSMFVDTTDTDRVQIKDPTKLPLTGGEITGDLSVSQSVTAQEFLGNLVGNATSATNAATVNGLTVQTAVPKNAVFTDTTYEAASASAAGLVSTAAQTFAGQKTFNGPILASGASTVTTAQARNIYAGTSDMTAGETELETGAIYLVYE